MQSVPQIGLRHKTLTAYYSHLSTLLDYLVLITLNKFILLQTESSEYRELLKSTICATHDLPDNHALSAERTIHGSQQEAIDRILLELGRVSRKPGEGRNVLLAGDKVSYLPIFLDVWSSVLDQGYTSELPINTARPGVENRHANSPSSVLRSLPWKILRSRSDDPDPSLLYILMMPQAGSCRVPVSPVEHFAVSACWE